MTETLMHVPEKCSECGSLFDLSYDLHEKEEGAAYEEFDEPLCWNCRSVDSGKNKKNVDEDIEIELELEFE